MKQYELKYTIKPGAELLEKKSDKEPYFVSIREAVLRASQRGHILAAVALNIREIEQISEAAMLPAPADDDQIQPRKNKRGKING